MRRSRTKLLEFTLATALVIACACSARTQTTSQVPPSRPVAQAPARSADGASAPQPRDAAGGLRDDADDVELLAPELGRVRTAVARDLALQKSTLDALIASVEGQIGRASPSVQKEASEQMAQMQAWRTRLDEMSKRLPSADAEAVNKIADRLPTIEAAFMAEYERLSVAIANDHAQSSASR